MRGYTEKSLHFQAVTCHLFRSVLCLSAVGLTQFVDLDYVWLDDVLMFSMTSMELDHFEGFS